MKTLQNNFTTMEQSKRLLELGVPADSADCFYDTMRGNPFEGIPQVRSDKYGNSSSFFEDLCFWAGSPVEKIVPSHRIPCWSVGRLMEILMMCNTYLAPKEFKIEPNSMHPTLIENVVNKIEELEGYDMLDFSKLDE